MFGVQHAPMRHSPPHVRKSAGLRAARPAPTSKTLSAGPKITIGGGAKKARKEKEEDHISAEDDDIMAMSFLQYCAMCEKQIIVPNTSILYCSESCRRSDSIPTPPSADSYFHSSFSKTNQRPSTMHHHVSTSLPDLLPRLQPTPITGVKVARIPPDFHEGAADLDPTEWKPAEPALEAEVASLKDIIFSRGLSSCRASPSGGSSTSLSSSWKPKLHHRPSSAASLYLSQFHRSSDSLKGTRHRLGRAESSFTNATTPGLSVSPTVSSTGSEESLSGTSYEVVTRPRSGSRPTTAMINSPAEETGIEMNYEKQELPTVIESKLRSASGSLKELLTGGGGEQKAKAAM